MAKYSQGLKDILAAAQKTQKAQAEALKTALGPTRRIKAYRDANSAATSPATSGTKFLDAAVTGEIVLAGGKITKFGTTSNVTTKLAADLATGTSVLVLEGNGHSIEWTLGLAGSVTASREYTFPFNPSAGANVGINIDNMVMRPPSMIDSGTGPLSPAPTPNKPYDVVVEDWSSGSAVVAGIAVFDTQLPNLVFDDAEMQASMGDIKTYRSSQSVILGNMEFGAVLAGIHKGANSIDTNEPVYEVLVVRKPVNSNWENYPAFSGWSSANTDVFGDKPFKVKIRRQDGTVLHTHQLHDGLPINHPSLSQNEANVATTPIRPLFHCAGALPWRSHRAKLHMSAKKYFPGFAENRVMRASINHDNAAANGAWAFSGGGSQQNGMFNWRILPAWPMAINGTTIAADWPTGDPFLGETFNGANVAARKTGWRYEAGSVSGHDQQCVAGGARFDRAVMPTWYAIYMHDPAWLRPRGGESIVEMKEAAEFGYYNLPNFYVTDVKTGGSIPLAEVFNNEWAHGRGAYAGNDYYTAGGAAKAIPLFAGAAQVTDKNGKIVFNGTAVDYLHNYWSVAWSVIFDQSVIGVLASRHRLISSIMCQAGYVSDTRDPSYWFLTRQHAWRYMHLVLGWKISTDHEWGVPRQLIEQRLVNELNAVHTYIVKPVLIDNSTTVFHTALRNLGQPTSTDPAYTGSMTSTSMTFYMTHVLQMMKVFGLWDVLRAKSSICKDTLDFMIRCMDLMSIDYILDTTGYLWGASQYDNVLTTGGVVASSWADYKASVRPQQQSEDWMHALDGTLVGTHYSTEPLRYQYACMRRDWITEADVPCARANGIALAVAKYQAYLQLIDSAVAAGSTNYSKLAADFRDYIPPFAPIKAYNP